MEKHLVPFTADKQITTQYGDDMAYAESVLKEAFANNIFTTYRKEISENTRLRQRNDLVAFSEYLAQMKVYRTWDALANDPHAWENIGAALVLGFRLWLEGKGYALGTINVRLSTIRKYCELLKDADLISEQALHDIQAVKGVSGKTGRNIDESRERSGVQTRLSPKKAEPTNLTTAQVFQLKKTTSKGKGRGYDALLEARDALLTGLIFEHAMRCGEIVALNVESFHVASGTFTFYREKTARIETHELKMHTRIALETYLQQIKERVTGPLFVGYRNSRITKRAINARMEVLGQAIGVEGKLSPHDGRHFWTYDAFRNGTPLDKIVSGGGWNSPQMALRYAKRVGIANEGVKISEETQS